MRNKIIIVIIAATLLLGVGFILSQSANQAVSLTPAPVSSPTQVDTVVKEFQVEGKSFEFSLREMRVKKGDRVKITFKNTGGFHDLVIDKLNLRTKQIQAGQEDNLEFIADKAGTFEYFCSIGNHRQQGMVGNLIVEE